MGKHPEVSRRKPVLLSCRLEEITEIHRALLAVEEVILAAPVAFGRETTTAYPVAGRECGAVNVSVFFCLDSSFLVSPFH